MAINSFWVKFEEFGFYYRVKDGMLKQAPINDNGTIGIDDKVVITDISNNIGLDLLDQINQEFGSDLR